MRCDQDQVGLDEIVLPLPSFVVILYFCGLIKPQQLPEELWPSLAQSFF
jgi:hypothetical protein